MRRFPWSFCQSFLALQPTTRPWLRALQLWLVLSLNIYSLALGANLPLGGSFETSIAVDPTDPNHLAYVSIQELRVSTDGGATFQPPVRTPIADGKFDPFDPAVAFDSQGRLFWSYQSPPRLVFLAQCDPATGEILPGYPVNVTESLGISENPDHPWLAIDGFPGSPFADRLYLAWTHIGANMHVRTTYSTDQGMTWGPVNSLDVGPTGITFPVHNAVAPNGDVYLAFHAQPSYPADGDSGKVVVSRSTDGGSTYQPLTEAFQPGDADISRNFQDEAGTIPGARFTTYGSAQPWVLPDPSTPGRVYVVTCDDPDNVHGSGDEANVYIVTSTDHGSTWSEPVRIDSGPGDSFQLYPTAAIDQESGAIAVHYYDNRNGNLNQHGNYLLDVFATYSLDGGTTFLPDTLINDVPFDPDAGAPCKRGCGPVFSRVWGSSASDVFLVGFEGYILHYDGLDWARQPSGPTADLWTVWGSGPDDVFAVGDGGTILHYDGISWMPQTSGTAALIAGVWGTAPDDVFAVGSGGTILHYDGVSWSPHASGTDASLYDIWGSAADDVFAVGDGGTILHYDGSWSPQNASAGEILWDVWGSAPDDVFAVGHQGGIFHYDGASWSLHDSHPGRLLTGLWGSSGVDVFAVDYRGGILHWDGAVWSEVSTVYHGWGIWGSSGTDIFVPDGGGGSHIYHYDGVRWAEQDHPGLPSNPTHYIGSYNGMIVADDRAVMVWCGNDHNAVGDPVSQQVILDRSLHTTGVDIAFTAPSSLGLILRQSQPNPFRSWTSIGIDLPEAAHVTLRIYDANGRLVRQLLDGQIGPDSYNINWDGRDARGRPMPSGTYWYRINVDHRTETKRLVLVR